MSEIVIAIALPFELVSQGSSWPIITGGIPVRVQYGYSSAFTCRDIGSQFSAQIFVDFKDISYKIIVKFLLLPTGDLQGVRKAIRNWRKTCVHDDCSLSRK